MVLFSILSSKFWVGKAFTVAFSKSLVSCPHWRSNLKLLGRSWRWSNVSLALILAADFPSCFRTTSPGYCNCRCSYLPEIFQMELWGFLYLPRNKNGLRLDTKHLLSASVKALPTQNFELKILCENMNKTKNYPAEYQGFMAYTFKLWAVIENLVRVSL